jgi:hypothetical protein
MKKLLAALVFVLVLTGAVVAYAGGGMIGKAVDAIYPWPTGYYKRRHGNDYEKINAFGRFFIEVIRWQARY